MGSTPAGRISTKRDVRRVFSELLTNYTSPPDWKSSQRENFLGQRVDPIQQIFFARNAGDLIAQLAVLEKEKSRDGANVVL